MERKFKLAIITHVRRHPEIWDFTLDDYKKLDVRLTAWEQIVSELQAKGYDTDVQAAKVTWKRLKDTFTKRLKHYPAGSAKAWIYEDELQFLSSASSGADTSATEPDDECFEQDVKVEKFEKEGSLTTDDGLTDTSSISVASPSTNGNSNNSNANNNNNQQQHYERRHGNLRRSVSHRKEQQRAGQDTAPPAQSNGTTKAERTESATDRFDILGQYIAQTLRELSPEESSSKILEITRVLHTAAVPPPPFNARSNSSKTSQHLRK